MAVVGLRELSRQTGEVIEQIEATGEPAIVTRQGKPVAALVAVDGERLQDLVLSTAPEFVGSTREADDALASGAVRPMSEILSEMQGEAEPAAAPVEHEPQQLFANYAHQLEALSAETARSAVSEEASPEAIEALQGINVDYFRALVSQTLQDAFLRVRAVNVNAALAGKEHGDLDASLRLVKSVKAAEQLSYYPAAGRIALSELNLDDIGGIFTMGAGLSVEAPAGGVAKARRGGAKSSRKAAKSK